MQDRSPTLTPEFSGTERTGSEYKGGVQAQTSVGLKPRIFGFLQDQKLKNVSALTDPNLSLVRQGVGLEAEVSLWKNGLGRDFRLQQQIFESTSEMRKAQARQKESEWKFRLDVLFLEAAFLKQAVEIQKNLLHQGGTLIEWVRLQEKRRLLEPVHIAQANSAQEARKMTYENLYIDLRGHLNEINSETGLGFTLDTPFESIDSIFASSKSVAPLARQKKTIKALEHLLSIERAQIRLLDEGFKPDVTIKAQFLEFAQTGRQDDSQRCGSLAACRSLTLSLNFSFPIGGPLWNRDLDLTQERIRSLETQMDAETVASQGESVRLFEETQGIQRKINIINNLVNSNQSRLDREKERQKTGRATTFDLIRSQEDLAQSRIDLLHLKTQYLTLQSQNQLFEDIQ